MSGELPGDIIVNIGSRLPVKSVGRCRCVAKSWCTSLSDHFFVNKHLIESNQRHISNPEFVLLLNVAEEDHRLGFYKLDCTQISPDPQFVELHNPFKDFCCEHSFRVLGCCNGIVCLVHLCADIICLWNPCTGEYMKLPDPFTAAKGLRFPPVIGQVKHWCFTCPSGFYYNSVTNDYEIVRITSKKVDYSFTTGYTGADVYSLGKNECRRFSCLTYGSIWKWRIGHMVISGALHWISASGEKNSYLTNMAIFAFNIGSRDFKEITPDYGETEPLICDVKELRGKLCLVCVYDQQTDVWVMEDYGVAESWVKHHVVCPFKLVPRYSPVPICHASKGCVLIDHGDDLILYNPDNQWDIILNIGHNKNIFVGTYTESLLRFNVDIRVGYKSTFVIPSEKQVLTYKLAKRFQAGPLIQLPQNDIPLRYSLLVEPNSAFTCKKPLIDEERVKEQSREGNKVVEQTQVEMATAGSFKNFQFQM